MKNLMQNSPLINTAKAKVQDLPSPLSLRTDIAHIGETTFFHGCEDDPVDDACWRNFSRWWIFKMWIDMDKMYTWSGDMAHGKIWELVSPLSAVSLHFQTLAPLLHSDIVFPQKRRVPSHCSITDQSWQHRPLVFHPFSESPGLQYPPLSKLWRRGILRDTSVKTASSGRGLDFAFSLLLCDCLTWIFVFTMSVRCALYVISMNYCPCAKPASQFHIFLYTEKLIWIWTFF